MLVLQHNCATGSNVVEAVWQTGNEMGAKIVIMQEQRKIGTRDSTTSHPAYNFIKGGEESRVSTAQAKASRKQVTSRTELTGGAADYVQILDVSGGNLPGGVIRIITSTAGTPKYGETRGQPTRRTGPRS